MIKRLSVTLAGALLFTGCGDELETSGPEQESDVVATVAEGELKRTTIQAIDEETWVPVVLGQTVLEATDDAWDLRFRRIAVEMGPGVEAQTIEGGVEDFNAFATADAAGEWAGEPEVTGEEPVGRGRPTGPLGGWFDYNPMNHTVSPGERFYAVRTAEGACLKLRFEDYYDEAGTAGVVQFSWAPIEGCR